MTTDPLDTAEAILDQHPADWRDWTAEDVGANAYALQVILDEMETVKANGGTVNKARWERILALTERAKKAGRRAA